MSWTIDDCSVGYREDGDNESGWYVLDPFGHVLRMYGRFESRDEADDRLGSVRAEYEQAQERRNELRNGP